MWGNTRECDGLACGSVFSTTAHGHGVTALRCRSRRRPTTRISRVDWGMGVLQTVNTQVTTNRLPIIGNTMILVRLKNRT
uniref:Uncharacterized protein n=1 Tax=Hyaloperonospora arabidopsidis (strain Emoy2) TaxID=559515 RepID=M4BBI4_HYAAE